MAQQPARPVALLPRLGSKIEITQDARELALDLGENLFPGKRSIDELSPIERKHWIILASNVLWGKADLQHSIEAIAQVLDPGVQAGIEDILIKREFFFEKENDRLEIESEEREERKERERATHASNLLDQAQERRQARERWAVEEKKWLQEEKEKDVRLDIEANERNSRLKNRDQRERVGLGMAVVGFVFALVILATSLGNDAPWVAGGSGAVAATILGVVLRLVLGDQEAEDGQSNPPSRGDHT